MANRWRHTTIVVAVFALALALRACGIGKESFWHDEACSVGYSDNSIAEVLEDSARDVHPPLYYIGLHYWRRLCGDSDVRIRAYSLPLSLLGLLAVFLLAFDIGGWRAGLIALVLGAVNPLSIYFAQEARMYSQGPALCALGSWCLWRWMAAASSPPRPRAWLPWAVAYTFCASGALLTHYLSALVLTAQGLFALVWFGWRRQWLSFASYGISTLAVVVVFLPWFSYLMQFRPTLYHTGLDWIKAPPFREYYCFLGREFFWGSFFEPGWWQPTMVLALLVLGICLGELMRKGKRPTD
ncbi:glycosyltransferase family 39 protein, partial [Candidatus Sumerlaeota bacterium]|nr:glycosyltransferase family 39 protein [Candidatus Sumerlaeota bacterium]